MKLDWFNYLIKTKPKFWKNYLAQFNTIESTSKRYVVFDCETSGLNFKNDKLISIGAVAITNETICVNDFFEVNIIQEIDQNTLIDLGNFNDSSLKVVETEAIIQFLDYIKNAILVGHHTDFDIEMINQVLNKLNLGKLKNEFMDIEAMFKILNDLPEEKEHTLDELCSVLKIKNSQRLSACNNAFTTALLFLKLHKMKGKII